MQTYKIKFSCDEDDYNYLVEDAKKIGIVFKNLKENVVRSINSDFEMDIISEYIDFAPSREQAEILQPFKLLEKLEEKSGQTLDIKKFGAAMKNLGFGKQVLRIDKGNGILVPAHVYLFKWK